MLHVMTVLPYMQLDKKNLKYCWTKPTIKLSNISVDTVACEATSE